MNEHDSLEAELSALRPHSLSPELRQRIGDQFTSMTLRHSRWLVRPILAGGFVAACIVAAILLRPKANGIVKVDSPQIAPLNNSPPDVLPTTEQPNAFDGSLPTVWAYSRALIRSSRELDETLDKHSVAILPADQRGWQIRALMSDFNPIRGEL